MGDLRDALAEGRSGEWGLAAVCVLFSAPLVWGASTVVYGAIFHGDPPGMGVFGLLILVLSGFTALPGAVLWWGPRSSPAAHLRARVLGLWLMLPVLGFWALMVLSVFAMATGA